MTVLLRVSIAARKYCEQKQTGEERVYCPSLTEVGAGTQAGRNVEGRRISGLCSFVGSFLFHLFFFF